MISSPQGSPEMAKLQRSRSWKPRPRLPSNGRAAIASMGRRSSIRIGIPVASSPSSGTQPTSSLASNSAANAQHRSGGKFQICLASITAPPIALALVAHRGKAPPIFIFIPLRIAVASVGGAEVSTALDRFLCRFLANLVHPAPSADVRRKSVLLTPYRIAASQLPMERRALPGSKRKLIADNRRSRRMTNRVVLRSV